jgi:hypothetical protein
VVSVSFFPQLVFRKTAFFLQLSKKYLFNTIFLSKALGFIQFTEKSKGFFLDKISPPFFPNPDYAIGFVSRAKTAIKAEFL